MAHLLRGLGASVVVGGLALVTTASAQPAPNFVCQTQGLVIGAAEMNGIRVLCSVSGAPAGDQTLRLVTDRQQPLCEAALSNGGAFCVGTLITMDQPGQVVAMLLPSGVQYQVLPATDNGQASPSLQYTPLPSDAGQSGMDQPASDVGD
jgi:hypothetical protein